MILFKNKLNKFKSVYFLSIICTHQTWHISYIRPFIHDKWQCRCVIGVMDSESPLDTCTQYVEYYGKEPDSVVVALHLLRYMIPGP